MKQNNEKSNYKKHLMALGGLLITLGLSACAGSETAISHTDQCKAIFDEANAEVADESNNRAIELFNNLLNNCSGTGFMEESQYSLAQVYFAEEEWLDARAEFSLFATHFSGSPKAPMANYMAAVAGYNSPYKQGRDGSLTDQTLVDFKDFIDSYGDSPKLDSAKYYYSKLVERKAFKDYYVSYLYLRMGEPLAAAIYLKHFIEDFPESEHYVGAHLRLVESYTRLDQYDQARFYLDKLIHEVPAEKAKSEYLYKEIDSKEVSYKERIKADQKDKHIKAQKEL
jgi:outer membrane protein assembly factor BamD